MPSKRKRGLTQEEIWDDSALIQSWDEALEEYKLYHSIHARGENIEEVLKAAEMEMEKSQERIPEEKVLMNGNGQPHDSSQEVELDLEEGELGDETVEHSEDQYSKENVVQSDPEQKKSSASASSIPMALPMSNDENDPLRNLMMSWYYAGYYTGLYEGQQQAKAGK